MNGPWYAWRSIRYMIDNTLTYPRVKPARAGHKIDWDDMVQFDLMFMKWRDTCSGIPLEKFLSGILHD